MHQLTFSLKWLLIVIAASAVTATSLVYASIFWASLCLSLALLLLSVGILGVLYRSGEKRAYWTGFTLFGFCYVVLVFAPGFDRVIGHRLVTTKVLGFVEPSVRKTEDELTQMFIVRPGAAATDPIQEAALSFGGEQDTLAPQWDHFQEAGHSVFAVILAALGGGIARYFYASDIPAREPGNGA